MIGLHHNDIEIASQVCSIAERRSPPEPITNPPPWLENITGRF